MNEKFESNIVYVWQFVPGVVITILCIGFLQAKIYWLGIICSVGIYMVLNPLILKIKICREEIELQKNPIMSQIYKYSDIKKIEIKGRRLKMKMNEDLLDPGMLILSNPEKIKEGIKKYKPELLE